MKPRLTLPSGSSPRGAQLGRRNRLPDNLNTPIKLQMECLKWVDGDYDQWGAYWGRTWLPDSSIKTTRGVYMTSLDVYCAFGFASEENLPAMQEVKVFVRAIDRKLAKETVRKLLPNATFYR